MEKPKREQDIIDAPEDRWRNISTQQPTQDDGKTPEVYIPETGSTVAGTEGTQGSTGTAGGATGGQSGQGAAGSPTYGYNVDPNLQAQYENAMAALEQARGQAPTYGSEYDAQIRDLYNQIVNRGSFSYDSSTDPLYQQYVQDYVQQGKMAMRDTMGRAAGLTGGYGSSYGQAVGQQMYDQYLQKMADVLPETYGMALNAWNAEGDRLNNNLAVTNDLERNNYNRYLDALNQHNIDLDRAQTDADTWYGRMVDADREAYERSLDERQLQNDYYNRLIQLIRSGYKPTDEDYANAGLSPEQGKAIYKKNKPQTSTNSGGGGSSSSSLVSSLYNKFATGMSLEEAIANVNRYAISKNLSDSQEQSLIRQVRAAYDKFVASMKAVDEHD